MSVAVSWTTEEERKSKLTHLADVFIQSDYNEFK